MSADLIETPPDIDQIATRIAGNYLDAPISCAKLYREVVAALMAERAAKDTALSEITAENERLDASCTALDKYASEMLGRTTAAEAALSEMRAELERARKALEQIVGLDSHIDATPRGGRKVIRGPLASIAARALASQDDGEER